MSSSVPPYLQSARPYDEGDAPRLTPAVLWLLALNVAVYFVQETVQRTLPQLLGFHGAAGLLPSAGFEWWTLVTYMFVHAGFWHLAFNMYALWAFGPRLEAAWGARRFTYYYLWCGLGGVALHALFVRGPSLLVGASAAVFGVLLAFALRWPEEEVLFFGLVPMKVKWYVGFLAAITLLTGMRDPVAGGVAHLAHLGGLAFGGLWLLRPAAPDVERFRRRVSPTPDVTDDLPRAVPPRQTRPARERGGSAADEVVERSRAITAQQQQSQPPGPPLPPIAPPPAPRPPRPARAAERNAPATPPGGSSPTGGLPALPESTAAARRAELDRLLDKISAEGIDSLTDEEKKLLVEASQELRGH